MAARVVTVAFEGVEARRVDVEVQLTTGQNLFMLVGLGDKTAALGNFEQVLVLDPSNKGAQNNIDILKAKPRTPAKAPARATIAKKK